MSLRQRGKKPMISFAAKLMYGSGSLGYCVVQQTMNGLIMFFGTVAHDVPGWLMGIAISAGTFWNAVADPVMGQISDSTESKLFGRRNGYMLIATFLVAITNVALWSLPFNFHVAVKFVWFFAGIMMLNTFNTTFQVPYHALGIELSGDYYERTVIQGFKTIFFLIGMVIPTVLMGVMLSDKKDVLEYQNLAYISSILMLICGSLTFLGTYSHLPRLRAKQLNSEKPESAAPNQIVRSFLASFKDKNFRSLVLGYTITLMSSAFITAVGLHFLSFTFYFNFGSIAILLGGLFATTILSQPFWLWMSKKIDKKPSLIVGIIITLVGLSLLALVFVLYLYAGIIPDRPLGLLLPAMMVIGVGVGAMFSMPVSMLGDFVAIQAAKDKKVKTATYNAFMTFSYKASQAVILLVIGILLDIIRFNSELSEQTFAVRAGLGFIIIIGIATVLSIGLVLYGRYSIKKEDVPFNAEPGA